jgi:hypothetical protein
MRSVLRIIVLVPLGLIFLYFALANRGPVTIFLDPFSHGEGGPSFAAPVYLVVLASIALGVVGGGVSSWVAHGRYRRAAKAARADAKKARTEADQLRGQALASLSPEPRGSTGRSLAP